MITPTLTHVSTYTEIRKKITIFKNMSFSLFPKLVLFIVSKLMNKATVVTGMGVILRMKNMDCHFRQYSMHSLAVARTNFVQ